MKTVKIIVGTYGYMKNGTPPVDLIDKKCEPIEVSDEEAERLINLGVAKAATLTSVAALPPEPAAAPESKETETPTPEVPMVTGHLDAESLKDYSYNELRSLAKKLGLDTTGKTAELIERIAAAQVQAPATEDNGAGENGTEDDDVPRTEDDGTDADNEKPPVLTAAEPE